MNQTFLKGLKAFAVASLLFSYSVMAVDIQIDGGTILAGVDIQDIMVDPDTNIVAITTVAGNWDITQGDPDPGDPTPQVTLLVNGLGSSSANIGETFAMSWTILDATSCTPLGGNTEWGTTVVGLTDGNATLTVDFEGARTFSLRCVNGANTVTKSVSMTGIDPTPEPNGSLCPAEWTPYLSGDDLTWEDVFGLTWPQPTYSQRTVTVDRAGYLSLEFNTANFADWRGSLKTITAIGTQGNRLIAISKCPGDFSEHLTSSLDACSEDQYNGGAVAWSTQANPSSSFCALDLDTTFYVNITFTADGINPETDRCDGDRCRTVLQAYSTP